MITIYYAMVFEIKNDNTVVMSSENIYSIAWCLTYEHKTIIYYIFLRHRVYEQVYE